MLGFANVGRLDTNRPRFVGGRQMVVIGSEGGGIARNLT